MATQTITLTSLPNLATPTLKVFPVGSDTAVSGSPFTLTEATNAKGRYAVTFTGTLAGEHECFLYSGATQVASGFVTLANATGSYEVRPVREVVLAGSQPNYAPAKASDVPTAAQNADKLLGRNLAGGSDGGRTVQDALRPARNKVVFNNDGTFNVYDETDTVVAWSGTYARGANTLGPLTGTDPA